MDPTAKPWWQSVTVWGVVITALSGLLGRYGVDLAPEDEKALAAAIVAVVMPLGLLWGVIQTIWGRARAKAPLTGQVMPRSGGGTASAAAIAPLALAIAVALGVGACAAEPAKMFGGLAPAVGEAAYTIERKTDLVGRTGATAVAVVQVRDAGAAAKMRATLASNDAFVAQACPLARMVDVIVAGR